MRMHFKFGATIQGNGFEAQIILIILKYAMVKISYADMLSVSLIRRRIRPLSFQII